MADIRYNGQTSNLIRFTLKHATTGQGLTGLSSSSTGLIISTIADVEASATTYTAAGSTIETISALGTYAAPTATKCRFKEVDATNHKGLYEFQFADARFSVSNAKRLVVSVTGAANLLDADYEIDLLVVNPYDGVRLGLTALPNAAADAAGGLPISDVGGLDLDARLDAAVSSRLAPTTAGRTLDVTATGEAGIDWANIGGPTTAVNLSGTTVKTATDVETDTQDIQSRLPAALVAGRMDSNAQVVADKTGYSLAASQIFVKKNVQLDNFEFPMYSSTDHVTPTAGLTVSAQRSIDGGAFGACANAVAEVGSGVYKITLAASDVNGTTIMLRFTAVGADDTLVLVVTQP